MSDNGMRRFFEFVRIVMLGSILLWPLGVWKAVEIVIAIVRYMGD
jgi:hypothetical protein